MLRFVILGALIACGAAPAANGQPRTLRFFFSTIGLSDPGNVLSPALNPAPEFGINPHIVVQPNQPTRLYLWAKLEAAGTPNNATFNGVSFHARITGPGGAVSGFNFWNYTNGSYGNGTGRWQQFSISGDATSASFAGAAVVTGAGINNTANAAANDTQYRRFAPDGVTRIDATLLGWVEFAGSQPGSFLQSFLSVGNSGIAQSGQPPGRVYFGWGDEDSLIILGNCVNCQSNVPEATIFVVPEPASVALLALGMLCLRRR